MWMCFAYHIISRHWILSVTNTVEEKRTWFSCASNAAWLCDGRNQGINSPRIDVVSEWSRCWVILSGVIWIRLFGMNSPWNIVICFKNSTMTHEHIRQAWNHVINVMERIIKNSKPQIKTADWMDYILLSLGRAINKGIIALTVMLQNCMLTIFL